MLKDNEKVNISRVPRRNYDAIYNDLLGAKSWLESLHVKTEGTRFEKVLGHVDQIIISRNEDRLSELIDKIGNEVLWYALTESSAFVDIYKTFRRLKSNQIPKGKIKDIINGPFLPREEISGSGNVNNRNILFELELASHLMKRGVNVISFDDIQFEHYGYIFHVQCKRPFTENNLKENIDKAYSQLKDLMDNNKNKGIIALSLEKILCIDDKILAVRDAGGINSSVYPLMNKFKLNKKDIWNKYLHLGFIGVILVLKYIVDISSVPTFF